MLFIMLLLLLLLMVLLAWPWLKERLAGGADGGYRKIEPGDFGHLRLEHYDEGERWLGSRSFDLIASYLQPGLEEQGERKRTFLRTLVSEDMCMAASLLWYVAGEGDQQLSYGLMAFETELSDGSFLVTSNTDVPDLSLADLWTNAPPAVRGIRRPLAATPAQLLIEHQTSLRERLAATPDLSPRPIASWEELVESKRRMKQLTSASLQAAASLEAKEPASEG